MDSRFPQVDEGTSRRMRRVGQANTPIEKRVRRILHGLGFRFRLGSHSLPGKPDIVLGKHKAVVFVHGCFWHGHEGCEKGRRMPVRHNEFWRRKIEGNRGRHEKVVRALEGMGWRVLTVWECQTGDERALGVLLLDFLGGREG